jgi:hypothetical protein
MAIAALGAMLYTRPAADAAPLATFNATAVADSARAVYAIERFLIVERLVDAGGATAQSHVDSIGSRSYAAAPDPGGTVVNYNGLVAAGTGTTLPFEYPFFASSESPGGSPAERTDPTGAILVAADASAGSASAEARTGATSADAFLSGQRSLTSVRVEGESIVATAETLVDAVSLPGGVSLHGIRSLAETTLEAGAEPSTRSELRIASIVAGDALFTYDREGLHLAGVPVPVDSTTAAAVLAETLGPAGFTIRFTEAEPLKGGITSPTVEIVNRPEAAAPGQPEGVLTLRLGAAMAMASGVPGAAATGVPTPVTPAPASAGAGAPAGRTSAGTTNQPAHQAGTAPAEAVPAATAPPATTSAMLPARAGSIESVYLALVAGVLLAGWFATGWIRRVAAQLVGGTP